MRVWNDEMTEEYDPESVFVEDGGVATLEEGEETEVEEEMTLDDYVLPVIVEAILDGRIPSTDEDFQKAAQLGLSLGVVVDTAQGMQLSREVEAQAGLALGYAANFDKIRGLGKSLHAPTLGRTTKRIFAKAKGRASTVGRTVMNAGDNLAKTSGGRTALYGGAALAGGAAGLTVKPAIKRMLSGGSRSDALVRNAEARNKK